MSVCQEQCETAKRCALLPTSTSTHTHDPVHDCGNACSMGVDRKRSPAHDVSLGQDLSFATASSSSSAAAYSRHNFTNRSATLPPPRSAATPPASAYFTNYAHDDTHVLEPTVPDANAHFAYSTTLRRHHPEGPLGFPQTPHGAAFPNFNEIRHVVAEEGPSGLFQRTVRTIRSYFPGADTNDYDRLPTHREESKDTPSARFAHVSIDVSVATFLLPLEWEE